MSDRTRIPIKPVLIGGDSPQFSGICGWQFSSHEYVGRLLREDIPQRERFSKGRIWIYRDLSEQIVGFGTLDLCADYGDFTGGQPHPYIPLLGVNPSMEGRGHGRTNVHHLIGEAALFAAAQTGYHHGVFLDVYADNRRAIELYRRCGFAEVSDKPRSDPAEGDRLYIIMCCQIPLEPV